MRIGVDVSRRAGEILGHAAVTDMKSEERQGLIDSLRGAMDWQDIPKAPRLRLEDLEAQIARN